MDCEQEPSLDLEEFKCMAANHLGVVVVFEQTNRRYSYVWQGDELALAAPDIQGACDPHPVEVVDCLARAVAHRASRDVVQPARKIAPRPARLPSFRLEGLLPQG